MADIENDSHHLDLKSSKTSASNMKNDSLHNNKIPVSESGALDLSTVRCHEQSEPKPNCDKVSSSVDDEIDDSDNEESDKLVIDTETLPERKEHTRQGFSPYPSSISKPSQPEKIFQQNSNNGIYSMPLVATHNSPHYNNREIENLQSRPNDVSQGERKTFENNSPSTEVKALDYRSKSPSRYNLNNHLTEPTRPNETNNYPTMDNLSMNQSLLSMIPPPNMGMLGNFPMPFGFSPFMMMPPNSFMPPATMANSPDNRFALPTDSYSNAVNHVLPYNPNLNLQQSKAGPIRKNSGNKISRSSQKVAKEGKQKDVVEIYECKTCNRRFSQVGNFHNHMKTHESKVCACGICNTEFSDSYELQRHMRNTHTGSMPYKCEQCDREFSQYNNLRRHLRVHNGKNYKCHLCGRTFNEVFYLEMHMGSHTGERTYKCGVCNSIFGDNAELQKHVSTHSAEELHTCNVCGKSFSKACVLRQHKKMHSGVRPFKCEVCDKSFIHRHHLTIHSRMHSTNKPYTCKICKKEFAQTSHLYKHIRQHTEQPGVTEEMIHESLAPILEKLKKSKDSQISPTTIRNEENLSDAINNDISCSPGKRDITPQSNDSREVTVENEMKLSEIKTLQKDNTLECEISSETGEKNTDKEEKREEEISPTDRKISEKEEQRNVTDKMEPYNEALSPKMASGINVKQIIEGSLREMEDLLSLHRKNKNNDPVNNSDNCQEKKSEISESDDNASDKTGMSFGSSLTENRYLNSPHSGIPYDEECLHESHLPRIPSFEPAQYYREDYAKQEVDSLKISDAKQEFDRQLEPISVKVGQTVDRYSPISQSGDSLSEEDFRSRSNSTCENREPNYLTNALVVSPRNIPSDGILKEQPIPKDNYTTKTEIVMPPKKRRRYTPRQKKKPQEPPEEPPIPKYQQMIQPLAAEAQQIYFLQLQQMQMALTANVMAAQEMLMQNASEQVKNLHAENQRNVHNNGYGHNADSNVPPMDLQLLRQPLFGTPVKGGPPFPMNMTKDGDPLDISRGPPFPNGSVINHSIAKAGYL